MPVNLTLGNTDNTLTITYFDSLTTGTGTDTVTVTDALTGAIINLGAGTDSLTLGDFGNSATISNTEAITGGLLADTITLSRDSKIGQRMWFTCCVHGVDFLVDCGVEMIGIGEGLVGEALAFEVFPAALDVVEFGGVFGEPFGRQPMATLGERGQRRLAGVNRPVVEDDPDGLAGFSRSGAVTAVEPFEKRHDIGAAFGSRGLDDEFAGGEIERPDHGDLLRPARRLDPEIGAALGPGTRQVRMGKGLRFIGEQQYDVAGQRLSFEQLQTQARTLNRLCVLAAFQGVAGPFAGKAPFLRSTTDSRDREIRWPVRRSISAESRGSVQLVRFSTGTAKSSRATARAASALTGERPGARWRAIAAKPSRIKAERQPRTVSSRTRKASPIAALVQPVSDKRIPRARSASSRSEDPASCSKPSYCSAVTRNGDLPAMIQPPNQRQTVNHQSIPLANHRTFA